jgi:hypothetical protein
MKKRKTIKIASITTGAVIAIVCLFIFLMPLFGNTEPPVTQSTPGNTIKAEGTTVNNNTDNEQEALTEKNGAEDIDEVGDKDKAEDIDEAGDIDKAGDIENADDVNKAGDIEDANEIKEDKNGDLQESGENLPGGGHEDPAGVETEHQFEGVE